MELGIIINSIEQALIFVIMSLGIFITFKILNFPDLTVDGSFTLGAVVSAVLTVNGHPILGIILALCSGFISGFITAILHTKFKIQYILAGILTASGLYSIFLRIADGKPNFSLFAYDSIFSLFSRLLSNFNLSSSYDDLILIFILSLSITLVLYYFFKTQTGMAIRATGDNEAMVKASSINSEAMKILAICLANGLVSLSAGIMSQYQSFYDISSGTGMMVIGLTCIIIGESIFGHKSIKNSFFALICGSIIYRIILAIALSVGLNPNDFKLFTAILVIFAILFPTIRKTIFKGEKYVKN